MQATVSHGKRLFLLIQERLNCKQQKVAPLLFLNPLEPELKLALVNFISLLSAYPEM